MIYQKKNDDYVAAANKGIYTFIRRIINENSKIPSDLITYIDDICAGFCKYVYVYGDTRSR